MFGNKELEEGLNVLGSDLKTLYEMHQEDFSRMNKEITEMKQQVIQLANPPENPEITIKLKEIDNVKIIMAQILELISQIFPKKEEKKLSPEEKLSNLISSVKKEKHVAYCIKCNEECNMVRENNEPIVNSQGKFIEGYCEKCGEAMFRKIE